MAEHTSGNRDDEALIDRLKAIAHPLRFAILQSLGRGEASVSEIEQASGIGQPTLSQQLSVLRGAGLVITRRQSKQVFYTLDNDAIAQCAQEIAALSPSAISSPGAPSAAHQSRSGAAVFATVSPR
ncbi:MAG: helix-turn-helix transcriptional regulator [Novosphingobium sp.]|nr:helix-turn-helix transcriptional regulator [Novosphingobium sp.]